jgi:hypothetical protein
VAQVRALRSRPMQDAAVLGGRQGAAGKRRRCLTDRVPAGLEAPCARRLQDLAVGTEECSRRGSNKEWDPEQGEEAGGSDLQGIALASLLPRVTTDHPCALSGSTTRLSAGGFVLVSVKGLTLLCRFFSARGTFRNAESVCRPPVVSICRGVRVLSEWVLLARHCQPNRPSVSQAPTSISARLHGTR